MKKRILKQIIAVIVIAMLMPMNVFAASFEDLQNAIDGNGGTEITDSGRENHYGYGKNEDTGSYGVESWTDNGNHNVQLNENVEQENNGASSVSVGSEDGNVVLDLNGNNIIGSGTGSVVIVGENANLTLDDGTAHVDEDGNYVSGQITGGATGVDTGKGSKFTMEEGTITNNDGDGLGGGVVDRGEFTMNGGEISNNDVTIKGGGVYVSQTGNFTMNGGEISNNTAGNDGGGVYVNVSQVDNQAGEFTMNGGKISNNKAGNDAGERSGVTEENETESQGGGVYVTGCGSFTMTGGEISGNTAGEGGGIFMAHTQGVKVEDSSKFTMTGGTVDGNKALLGEGGGIYIQGAGEISGGKITNNETKTTKDLGGGGIYIEITGQLTLKNAIITENEANGLGGGLAACVHGKTVVYATAGAAIYWNKAKGTAVSSNEKIDGHSKWVNNGDFKGSAKDIFTASDGNANDGSADHFGKPGVILDAKMLSSGDANLDGVDANWYGYLFRYNSDGTLDCEENGEPKWELVTVNDVGRVVYADRLLGLTANPDKETIEAARIAAENAGEYVLISGNKSTAHGGGIANNGMLIIGEGNMTDDKEARPNVELEKKLEKDKDAPDTTEDRVLKAGEFTFDLKDREGQEVVGTMTVYNDEDGNATFKFDKSYFNQAGTYTFIVTEQKNEDSKDIIYDETEYHVNVEVTEKTETVVIGNRDVTIKKLVATMTIYRVTVDEDGNIIREKLDKGESITFINRYTSDPNDPDDPDDPDDPNPETPENPDDPDPETPENPDDPNPETPENPGDPDGPIVVELPGVNVPLAEISEIEDPDVPLSGMFLTDIEDPDVPLANVPQTGDNFLVWVMVVLASAIGLVFLVLEDRKSKSKAK